jgi:hypothetical protein
VVYPAISVTLSSIFSGPEGVIEAYAGLRTGLHFGVSGAFLSDVPSVTRHLANFASSIPQTLNRHCLIDEQKVLKTVIGQATPSSSLDGK